MPEAETLWDWSCERYGRPGVAAACLALQDRHGAAVTLLLLGCWLADTGRSVAPEGAAAAGAFSAQWQAGVVRPLRQVRRHLAQAGGAVARLRLAVKEQELAAERIELEELQRLMAGCPAGDGSVRDLAMANLAALMPPAALAAPELAPLIADLLKQEDGDFRFGCVG